MDSSLLLTVIFAFLAAGVIKGATGMGLPTISVAIMTTLVGLREAIPILMLPSLAANIWQVMRGGRAGAVLRRFWLPYLAAGVGIWIGTEILFAVDPQPLTGLLGIVVMSYAAIDLFGMRLTLPPRLERPLGPPIGLAAGILTGTTGSMLFLLLLFIQSLDLDKETFVKALGLMLLIGSVAWIGALIAEGAMTQRLTLLSLIAVPAVLAGMTVGHWCRDWIPQQKFRMGISVILLLLGANLVREGFL